MEFGEWTITVQQSKTDGDWRWEANHPSGAHLVGFEPEEELAYVSARLAIDAVYGEHTETA